MSNLTFNLAGPPLHLDDPQRALDRSVRHAMILAALLVVVVALMASVIRVTGAVMGNGKLSVESLSLIHI